MISGVEVLVPGTLTVTIMVNNVWNQLENGVDLKVVTPKEPPTRPADYSDSIPARRGQAFAGTDRSAFPARDDGAESYRSLEPAGDRIAAVLQRGLRG